MKKGDGIRVLIDSDGMHVEIITSAMELAGAPWVGNHTSIWLGGASNRAKGEGYSHFHAELDPQMLPFEGPASEFAGKPGVILWWQWQKYLFVGNQAYAYIDFDQPRTQRCEPVTTDDARKNVIVPWLNWLANWLDKVPD